jgi:DNA polymerase type B, organellar and viral
MDVIFPTAESYESPSCLQANQKAVYSLDRSDFIEQPTSKKRKSKAEADSYLIIGFDSEFKSPSPIENREVEEGKAKYRVLSYQFHVVTNDSEWSGICVPDDNERMSLGEYIVVALASGKKQGKVEKLPTRIYLVGHFSRADLPAFSDFKNLQKSINNVRNSFISNRYFPLDLEFEDGEKPVRLEITFRDTMLLVPGHSKSLKVVGEFLGQPKIVLDSSPAKEREIKRNMDALREENWDLFKQYAINDSVLCAKFAGKIIDLHKATVGKETLPATLTSIGVSLLLKNWEGEKVDHLATLGREEISEKRWDYRSQHYKNLKREVLLPECSDNETLAVESYHGGRNEEFYFGVSPEREWSDFDLASAYPTAMSLIGKPSWTDCFHTKTLDDFHPTTLGFARVKFKFPDSVRYPTLPVRTENGLVFPLQGISYCSSPEIVVARNLGAELQILDGRIFPTDPNTPIFRTFIKDCIEKRKRYPKNSFESAFWKEIANSTYGKTAQGLREKRVYDMRDQKMKVLPPSRITNPFFASYITSFVRALLGEIINGIPENRTVFSATTDGFITDTTDEEIVAAQTGTLAKVFMKARKDLTGNTTILEKKHSVRQLLGWQTRGQATLKPGTPNPNDPNCHLVLARGGIATPDKNENDAELDNDFIVRTFFDRTPTSSISSTILTTVKDMVEYDADLVEKVLDRRLNMEFDWKRRPDIVGMDPQHDHLSFDTTPWKNIGQFQTMREFWSDFQRGGKECLKTMADYERFAAYANARAADENGRVFVEDGDLRRLKQGLCRAWKHSVAGVVFGEGATSASTFAGFLTSVGIPTQRHDVENAARKPFVPNAVPRTSRCVHALEQVSRSYPSIRIDDFLANEDEALLPSIVVHADHRDATSNTPKPNRRFTPIGPSGPSGATVHTVVQ